MMKRDGARLIGEAKPLLDPVGDMLPLRTVEGLAFRQPHIGVKERLDAARRRRLNFHIGEGVTDVPGGKDAQFDQLGVNVGETLHRRVGVKMQHRVIYGGVSLTLHPICLQSRLGKYHPPPDRTKADQSQPEDHDRGRLRYADRPKRFKIEQIDACISSPRCALMTIMRLYILFP
jgi:hypothetical protein